MKPHSHALNKKKRVLSATHGQNIGKHVFSGFSALGRSKPAQGAPKQPKSAQGRQWELKGIPQAAKVILKTPKGRPRASQRTPGESEVRPKEACG